MSERLEQPAVVERVDPLDRGELDGFEDRAPVLTPIDPAGHTHGGQVWLPGIGRPVVPSAYGERFAIGHVVEGGRHLFVSSGVGTSILPVRFLVPPEVSVLTLRPTVSLAAASGSAPSTPAGPD